jgi:hypothetical protein
MIISSSNFCKEEEESGVEEEETLEMMNNITQFEQVFSIIIGKSGD